MTLRALSPKTALVAAIVAGIIGPAALSDDEWPRYAHDGALTGRTPLRGDIVAPRVAWSVSVAGTALEVELRPVGGRHRLEIDGGKTETPRSIRLPAAPLRDIDGSGTLRPAPETYHERWAKVLPDVGGLQRTRWDQTWTTAPICHLELWANDGGAESPRLVWRSAPEGTVFMPLCVVHDIDADGTQEICVALHYRVMLYEATTGRKESELRFHSSRSYGWFGLADVDADGLMEMVVLSDFQSHLDVIDIDPTRPEADRLSVKWRRDIETRIEMREKWPQIGPRPLADVDGDGDPEIVINLHNDSGDGEWHVVVIDAASGKMVLDLPRRYTHGNADVDGDGAAEIFCVDSSGVRVSTRGRAEIIGMREGRGEVEWSRDGVSFALADLPALGALWSTGATAGMRHVLLTDERSRPAFLAVSADSVTALRHDGERIDTIWQVSGFDGAVEAAGLESREGGVAALVRVRMPPRSTATLEGQGAAPVIVSSAPLGTASFMPIAARLERNGPVHVIVEGAGESIVAIRPPPGDGASEIVWQRRGRGMGDGSRPGGVLAVDLDGDGANEVVAASESPEGAAALVAFTGDGATRWRRVFDGMPGARPVHNVGGLTAWWPGRLRSPDSVDLFVNTRRGLMHSDVGNLVDGRTGEVVWSRERASAPGQFTWGYAGVPLGIADVLGDAREELVNLFPVCFWVADGATGELVAAVELASRKSLPAWAAYGEPIVHDVDGDGKVEVLLDSVYILALLDREGRPIWHGKRRADYPTGSDDDNVGETTATKHALLDLDADGRLEIASAGYRDGVRAIDARDGTVLWSLDAPKPTGHKCSAADIDGRDGDELIYVARNTLVVVTGDRRSGRILWTWDAPATLSLPAIADLDGDGRAEIAVQSADGTVYVLDGSR